MVYFWLGIFALFCVVEAFTAALVCIWFIVGAIAAFIVALFIPVLMVQLIAFVVISAITFVIARPFIKKRLNKKHVPTNADRVIGQTGEVLEAIEKNKNGRIKVDNISWVARSSVEIPAGALCTVLAIEGVTLIVDPK